MPTTITLDQKLDNRVAKAIENEWERAQKIGTYRAWRIVYENLQGMWSFALFADIEEMEDMAQFLQDIVTVYSDAAPMSD